MTFDLGTDRFLQYGRAIQGGQNEIPTVIVKEQTLEKNKIKPYIQ